MYLEREQDQDKKMAARWKSGVGGILVFTGLFSAAVATFLGVSAQDLKPSSQDTSVFYLANIYQLLAANANGSSVRYLGQLSLVLELGHEPYMRTSGYAAATIRSFFAEGVEELRLPLIVEALPALLHTSLLLIFSGLVIFLSNVHHTLRYWRRLVGFKERYLRWLLSGLVKVAEETAEELGSAIDGRALSWMLESLDEDHELERFFAAIPGF
ncbi:hypothetical protein BC827DRAFT_1269801 [Russula dissimulans]|nr:hypothetical protein BC827DRAFT_1269801 [Russula dissimulans]